MKSYILFIAILLGSCQYDGTSFKECGEDIKIGEFLLTDSSRQFIPYNGTETLTFEDNDGVTHELKSQEGRATRDSPGFFWTICTSALLNAQYEYYDIQTEEIEFRDSLGNHLIELVLRTVSDKEIRSVNERDSMVVFNLLKIETFINKTHSCHLQIITEERQNNIDSLIEKRYVKNTRYIGDTFLYQNNYLRVYEGKTSYNSNKIYFNKEKGVIAIKISDEEYWVLKE